MRQSPSGSFISLIPQIFSNGFNSASSPGEANTYLGGNTNTTYFEADKVSYISSVSIACYNTINPWNGGALALSLQVWRGSSWVDVFNTALASADFQSVVRADVKLNIGDRFRFLVNLINVPASGDIFVSASFNVES